MSFKANLILTITTRIANTGLGALSAIIAAWEYGDIGLGIFALLRTLPSVLLVFTEFGFSHAYPYLINNKKYSTSDTLSSGLYSAMLVSSIQIVIWMALAQVINSSFNLNLSNLALYLSALLAPLLVLEIHIINFFRSIGKIHQANLMLALVELLIVIFLSTLYFFGLNNLDYLSYILLVTHIIVVIFMFITLYSYGYLNKPRYNQLIFKESFKFGVKSQVGNAFQVLNYRLDHLIIGLIVGPSALAIYVVATKAAEFFRFFSLSVMFVVEPIIAKADPAVAEDTVKKYYIPVFLINLFFITVGGVTGPFMIPILFDQWSEDAIFPFKIIMFGLAFVGANGLIGAYNLGQGKPQLNTISIGITLLVTIIFNILLTPKFGVVGASIASSIAFIFSTLMFAGFFIRECNKNKRI